MLKGNFIGVDATHAAPLPNNGHGVFVENDSINNQVVGNVIAFNQGAGVRIPDDPSNPSITKNPAVQISVSGNLIHSNPCKDVAGRDLVRHTVRYALRHT